MQNLSQAIRVEVLCLGRLFETQRTPLPGNSGSKFKQGVADSAIEKRGGMVYNLCIILIFTALRGVWGPAPEIFWPRALLLLHELTEKVEEGI